MNNKPLGNDYKRLMNKLKSKQDLNGIQNVIYENAKQVKIAAKSNAPVDTGELRKSITRETAKMKADVRVGAEYGDSVEYGTSRQDAQPYLGPAVNQREQSFINEMEQEFRK